MSAFETPSKKIIIFNNENTDKGLRDNGLNTNEFMKTIVRFLILICVSFSLSCSREGEEKDKKDAVVRLRMPGSSNAHGGVVAHAINAPGGWDLTDPTTLDDILCYVVAVSGPEDYMSKYTCSQVDGTPVFQASLFGGPALPNNEISMSIPSGSARTFYIIGLAASSVSDCMNFTLTGIPLRENVSAPHVIGSKTVDLVPGTLDLEVEISMTGATKFNECSGPYFNPDPAVLVLSEDPLYDYGDYAVGSSTDHTFTIENKGGSTATGISEIGLAAPYSIKGGTWPGTGGTCATSLGSSDTCTFVVTYAPTVVGTPTDTIEISYNDGYDSASVTRNIQAIASAPAFLSISDGPTYDYGNTTVMTLSLDKTFTITNTGSYVATAIVASGLAAPFTFKDGTYPGTGGTCGVSLASLATCTIVVTFTPPGTIAYSDTLNFDYVDGAFPATSNINLQGDGATPASLSLTASPSLNLGTRAIGSTTANGTITITNTGEATATAMSGSGLAAPFNFTGGTYPGTTGTCGATLAPGASCTIRINFSPTILGLQNDTVDISYHDALATQTASRNVHGTGANPASLAITNSPLYDFGNVVNGATSDFTFTISNSGGVNATGTTGPGLAAPFTFKGGTYPGTGGTCGTTIGPGASCNIVLTYAPTSLGAHTDTLNVTYNNGVAAGQITPLNVQGTGIAPASLAISNGPTYNFGTVTNTLTSDFTFTVSNSGAASATSIVSSGLAAPFTFKDGTYPGTGGTCGGTLAPAASCTIVITYAPTVAGLQTDTAILTYHNGAAGGQTATVNVQGTGADPASLSISNSPLYDYGNVNTGVPTDFIFTVTNNGDVSATNMAGGGLIPPPFEFKGGTYPGAGGDCSNTLTASTSCTIVITFTPVGLGLVTDTAEITYDDGVSTGLMSTINVQGTGQ